MTLFRSYSMCRLFFVAAVAALSSTADAQYFSIDASLARRNWNELYSTERRSHSSIQPYGFTVLRDLTPPFELRYDSSAAASWLFDKVFQEHFIEYRDSAVYLYADVLPDLMMGHDSRSGRWTYTNTRGFFFGGSVSANVHFQSEFFENQSTFPDDLTRFVNAKNVVPGQGFARSQNGRLFDYNQAAAHLSYAPSEYLTLSGGHGKHFIGDGYRSLLLSDNSFPYPYVKMTVDLWKFRYLAMWTEFQHIDHLPNFDTYPWAKKAGVFHYLDIAVTPEWKLGVFESIIWVPTDSIRQRGVEWNYLNPIIFLRPTEFSIASPDNVLMGLNSSYTLRPTTVVYGQFVIDEITFKEFIGGRGYWGNKYGIQAGVKQFDAFGISRLFLQAEMNRVTPYTYAHRSVLKSYGHYNQSLAHPTGSNFIESLVIAGYSWKRFDVQLQVNYNVFGTDTSAATSVGQDLFRPYTLRVKDFGNEIGQGDRQTLVLTELRGAYRLNPLTNLRIEFSLRHRSETSAAVSANSIWWNIGIRSSFRNIYYDF